MRVAGCRPQVTNSFQIHSTQRRHKAWTFSIAGSLIAASFVMTYVVAPRLRTGEVCEADDPTTCGEFSRFSRIILWLSALIWSCGFFVAYLLGLILERMDR